MNEGDKNIIENYNTAVEGMEGRGGFFSHLSSEFQAAIFTEDNAPEYIMRGLDHSRRREVLDAETKSDLQETFLDKEMVAYLREVYWGGKDKHVLGRSVSELIDQGFKIPERMIHETMYDEVAMTAAEDLRDVVSSLGIGGTNPNLIELNTGLGSFLHRLRGEKFNILASVDRNSEILKATTDIWHKLKINGVSFVKSDAMKFVKKKVRNGKFNKEEITVITADPPWEKYITNDNGDHDFTMFKPDGRKIISELIEHAPVVALKLPGNFDLEQMREFAAELDVGVRFYSYEMVVGNRNMREAMAVFIRGSVNGNVRWVHEEKTIVYND